MEWYQWPSSSSSYTIDDDVSTLLMSDVAPLDLAFRATSDIEEGDELFIDYGNKWINAFANYLTHIIGDVIYNNDNDVHNDNGDHNDNGIYNNNDVHNDNGIHNDNDGVHNDNDDVHKDDDNSNDDVHKDINNDNDGVHDDDDNNKRESVSFLHPIEAPNGLFPSHWYHHHHHHQK